MKGSQIVHFTDVCVSYNNSQILHGITGFARSGEVLAVMGPSGSGKTTLLNSIAGRVKLDSGDITLDNIKMNKFLRRRLGYVLQHDTFFANLTMRETIYFAAMMKLPRSMPHSEKMARIDEVVDALHIRSCLDTNVGSALVRGLSGGERKRVNIACELVTNPDILLIDEPTSGLDSFTAHKLMMQLKEYATSLNKVIITTIHQPSSQIFYSFNKLLLIAKGNVIYFGEGEDVIGEFDKMGFKCEPNFNPADFILEKVNCEEDELEVILQHVNDKQSKTAQSDNNTSVCHLSVLPGCSENSESKGEINQAYVGEDATCSDVTSFHMSNMSDTQQINKFRWIDPENGTFSSDPPSPSERDQEGRKWPTTFWTQYCLLTWRHFKLSRSYILSKLEIFQVVILCVLIGALWFQIDRTDLTVSDTMGLIFFACVYWNTRPLFAAVLSFSMEIPVVNKERAAGMYRLSAYILAKMTSELPLVIVLPAICYPIIYWMAGLNPNVGIYFASLGVTLLCAILGQSVGLAIGAAFVDVRHAMTAASLSIMASMLLGGFFTRHIPIWLDWTKFLSMQYHPYRALLILEYSNSEHIRCETWERSPLSHCDRLLGNATFSNETIFVQSEAVLHQEDIRAPVYCYILSIVGMCIFYETLVYVAFRCCRKPR